MPWEEQTRPPGYAPLRERRNEIPLRSIPTIEAGSLERKVEYDNESLLLHPLRQVLLYEIKILK
jgi:hypothetical protein